MIQIRNNLIITISIVLFSLALINSVTAIAILPDNWVAPETEISNPESPDTNTSNNTSQDPEISAAPEITNNNLTNISENSENVNNPAAKQEMISYVEKTNESTNLVPDTTNSTNYPNIETADGAVNNTEDSNSGPTSDSSAPYAIVILSVILGGTLIMIKK